MSRTTDYDNTRDDYMLSQITSNVTESKSKVTNTVSKAFIYSL